jgi:glycosyltransferase involved in cell wall biosynthesis
MSDPSQRSGLDPLFARLSIVIPAYNEEAGIRETLGGLLSAVPGAEIIVVDDGSSDGTAKVAAEHPGVTLAQHPFNRGYGAALKTGMSVATREFVAWFDADNEHRVADLIEMVRRIDSERVAAVIAQRRTQGPSPLRNAGKLAIRLLARSLKFRGGKDINCGLRVFRREIICRYLPLLPNSFSASITSTMIMLERGYPIGYHAVEVNPRLGDSKVKVADGFVAVMLVLRMIMLFAPMRIFLRAGIALFAIGLVYGVLIAAFVGLGLPAASIFLMLAGVMAGFFGLVADQISQLRLAQYDQPVYRLYAAPPPADTFSTDPHQ